MTFELPTAAVWLVVAVAICWLVEPQIVPLMWALVVSMPLLRCKEAIKDFELEIRAASEPQQDTETRNRTGPKSSMSSRARMMHIVQTPDKLALITGEAVMHFGAWIAQPFKEILPVSQSAKRSEALTEKATVRYFAVLYRLLAVASVTRLWRNAGLILSIVVFIASAQLWQFSRAWSYHSYLHHFVAKWLPRDRLSTKVLALMIVPIAAVGVVLAPFLLVELRHMSLSVAEIPHSSEIAVSSITSAATGLLRSTGLPDGLATTLIYSLSERKLSETESPPVGQDSLGSLIGSLVAEVTEVLPRFLVFMATLWYVLEAEISPGDILLRAAKSIGDPVRRAVIWALAISERLLVCAFKRTVFYLIFTFSIATLVGYPYPIFLALVSSWIGFFLSGTPEVPVLAIGIALFEYRWISGVLLMGSALLAWWFIILGIHAEVPGQNKYWIGLCSTLGVVRFKSSLGLLLGPMIGCVPLYLISSLRESSGVRMADETQVSALGKKDDSGADQKPITPSTNIDD